MYNNLWLHRQKKVIMKYKKYVQIFYEETSEIDRNYQPSQPYFKVDDIRNFDSHFEDMILEVVVKGYQRDFSNDCKDCPNPPYYSFWNHKGFGKSRGKY